jgi:hypothetical protein
MGAFALPAFNGLTQTAAASAVGVGVGAGASTGVAAGLLSNPITAVAGIGLGVFQLVDGIFKRHHAVAVANEAAALNDAVPSVEQALLVTFDAVNKGQITAAQATQLIDSLPAQYKTDVYDTFKVKQKSGNGPDVVLKDWIQPDVSKAEALLASGKAGTVQLDAIPAHAGFAGVRQTTLTFNGSPWTVPDAISATPAVLASGSTIAPVGPATAGVIDATAGSAVASVASSPSVPVLTAAPTVSINWSTVLIYGGLILVAIWLFSGSTKGHRR